MNLSERVAKAVVEHILTGSAMYYRSDQSSGEYDFDLRYPDGTLVRLEVTMSANQQMKWSAAKLTDERKGGHVVKAVACRNGWLVHPLPDANINLIREKVDVYLAKVEAAGLTRFFAWTDALESEPVERILRELKIEAGCVFTWKGTRRICIALPGQGGMVTSDHVQRAVESEASKADNRRKLGAGTQSERHLFIYVDPLHYLPWVALVNEEPPAKPPPLPAEISHIWVATITRSQNEYIVWRAARDKRWDPPVRTVLTVMMS
jgi:hypothetical protein